VNVAAPICAGKRFLAHKKLPLKNSGYHAESFATQKLVAGAGFEPAAFRL
jgi:hypothetical protein